MAKVTKAELLWREWFLGEGTYRGHPRDPATRRTTEAPEKIPAEWWQRLEAFLAKRDDYREPGHHDDEPAHGAIPKATRGKLTAHFSVPEFDCHDGRHVPEIALPALKRLCHDFLEPLRVAFGPAIVLSGYRPKDYNAKIHGAPFSQHIYELTPTCVAADMVFRTGRPADWYRLADQLGAGGLGRYDRSGFIHCDNRPYRARWTG